MSSLPHFHFASETDRAYYKYNTLQDTPQEIKNPLFYYDYGQKV